MSSEGQHEIYALKKGKRAHLKDVYGLLLDRQHSQDVPVQVEALVVGQDDLVTLEGPGVTQPASVQVDDVEGVVFQRGPRVRSHRFVVAIHLLGGWRAEESRGRNRTTGVHLYIFLNFLILLRCSCLKEVRRRLLWDVHGRPDDHVAAVVREEAALPVEVFSVRGHVSDVEQREEALKQAASDVEGTLVIGRQKSLPLLASQQVLSRLAALIFVYLEEERWDRKVFLSYLCLWYF